MRLPSFILMISGKIPESKRKLERELWNDFESVKPRVLGGLLDAVSYALRNLNNVKLDTLPRMADFAQWVVAAEPKLPWDAGKFMEIYKENRNEAMSAIFEIDGFSMALKLFLEDVKSWSGTASELKAELEQYTQDEDIIRNKYWPKAPNKVSQKIRLIAPSLRSIGIDVEFVKKGKTWKFNSK